MQVIAGNRNAKQPTGNFPWAFACAALFALPIVACSSKPKNFDNENDALRKQVIELEKQLGSLTAERGELQAKLGELVAQQDFALKSGEPAAEVLESLPRCAGIEFSKYTGLADRDGTPGPESIDVYIRPFDGRQRFVQVAGRLVVTATLVPQPPGPAGGPSSLEKAQPSRVGGTPSNAPAEPRTLATVDLGPRDLREAYRSGPLGTHYTVNLPLNPANQRLDGVVVVYVKFTDAISGLTHEATQVVQ